MRHRIQRALAGLLAILLLTCPVFAATFPDVDQYAEYAEAVEYVSEAGIMVGDENRNFNPDKTVTRAEMATIICKMLGETDNLPSSTAFTDVPINHWANKYIGKAVELSIVSGYGNGIYGPSDNLTYEQAVTMIVRAVWGSEEAFRAGGYPEGFLSVAEAHGILEGVKANKGEYLSRSDIATLLFNYYVPPFLR